MADRDGGRADRQALGRSAHEPFLIGTRGAPKTTRSTRSVLPTYDDGFHPEGDWLLRVLELGMLYRLRKEMPHKIFHPVSPEASCEFMKMNDLEKLRRSLREDEIEVEVEPEVRAQAQAAIDRMLTIQ